MTKDLGSWALCPRHGAGAGSAGRGAGHAGRGAGRAGRGALVEAGWGAGCAAWREAQRAGAHAWRCDKASWGLQHGAGLATTRPRARSLGATCTRWLGQIGCLVHLTHFDSVFRLNTVSESLIGHCS